MTLTAVDLSLRHLFVYRVLLIH